MDVGSNYQIDILFDIDNRVLKLYVVESIMQNKEAKIWDVKYMNDSVYGWIPHINVCPSDGYMKIQIARIPVDWYSLKKDNIFSTDHIHIL